MSSIHRKSILALLCLGVLVLALSPITALASGEGLPTHPKYPAWYGGRTITIMMGPSGESSNPNQFVKGCFGLGPDFSSTSRSAEAPVFYSLGVRGATQMSCPDRTGMHDMVYTRVPGDAGYNAAVRSVGCKEGPNFDLSIMPLKSEQAVKAAIAAGQLTCGSPGPAMLSPVVGY